MSWIDALGVLGFVVVVIAPMTQVWKSWRTKDTHEIAPLWPLLVTASFFLILPTVLASNNYVLKIGHIAGMIANSLNLALILHYRRQPPG